MNHVLSDIIIEFLSMVIIWKDKKFYVQLQVIIWLVWAEEH